VCCDQACTGPHEFCNGPESAGICAGATAAPATSSLVFVILAVALAALGALAVRRQAVRR